MEWLEAKEETPSKATEDPRKGGGGTGSEGSNKEEGYFLPSKMERGMGEGNVM